MSLVFSRTRRRVYTTLSALKAVPSWKVTLLRCVKRQVVLLTGRQDSARAGTNFESFVTSTSGSKTGRSTEVAAIQKWLAGARVSIGSESPAAISPTHFAGPGAAPGMAA